MYKQLLGRRRYLKDINSQNAMVRGGAERNAVTRQSEVRQTLIAMINIHKKTN
jgi:DNA polymerase-1